MLKRILLSLLAITTLAVAPLVATTTVEAAAAKSPKQELCEGSGGTWTGDACTNANDNGGLPNMFRTIINVFLYIIGAIAVLMIVIGGLRYVISGGDSSAVTGAKNTILYSVIGLVVAVLAYAIVNFVINELVK